MRKHTRILSLVFTSGLLACTEVTPSQATSIDDEQSPNNWRVERFDSYGQDRCRLLNVAPGGMPELSLTGVPIDSLSYRLSFAEPVTTDGTRYAMMRIGDFSHRLQITPNGKHLQMLGFGDEFLAAFLTSDAMVVTINDETVANLDLSGADAAYEELQACIASLLSGPTIPPPPGASPPRSTGDE